MSIRNILNRLFDDQIDFEGWIVASASFLRCLPEKLVQCVLYGGVVSISIFSFVGLMAIVALLFSGGGLNEAQSEVLKILKYCGMGIVGFGIFEIVVITPFNYLRLRKSTQERLDRTIIQYIHYPDVAPYAEQFESLIRESHVIKVVDDCIPLLIIPAGTAMNNSNASASTDTSDSAFYLLAIIFTMVLPPIVRYFLMRGVISNHRNAFDLLSKLHGRYAMYSNVDTSTTDN